MYCYGLSPFVPDPAEADQTLYPGDRGAGGQEAQETRAEAAEEHECPQRGAGTASDLLRIRKSQYS